MSQKIKKILMITGGILVVVGGVTALSAYEAHVINVTAHIENALSVTPEEIMFGTVFPQEKLYEDLTIIMSESFFFEGRVDDIDYVIKQKPKPRPEFERQIGIAEARKWCHDNFPGFEFYPRGWTEYLINCYVPLCPYLSKMPDGEPANDIGLRPFHQMNAVANGRLAKSEQDIEDIWTIDLDVPCFEGYCAQDWIHYGWELPYDLESEVFGCDLWIEVTGISEGVHNSECSPRAVWSCDTGDLGVCEIGTKTCDQSGYWGECVGAAPTAEICDGLDNNCDGQTDEGNPGGGGSCDTGLMGICAAGTYQCQSGGLQCVQNNSPETEICDGLDNDCDGEIDEGCPVQECTPGVTQSCDTQLSGVCAAGTQTCDSEGFWGSCVQDEQSSPEVCDGLDNNCDGDVDEGVCPTSNWTYEQKFNSLTDGDLNGQDGWVRASGGMTVQTTTKYEGAKGLQVTGGAVSDDYNRSIDAISDGLVYIAMRVSGTPSEDGGPYFMLYSGTTRVVMIRFAPSGNIEYYTGGSFVSYLTFSANTWYVLAVEFNQPVQGSAYRLKIHDGNSWGSWTSWVGTENAYAVIDKIRLDHEGNSNIDAWIDTITPNTP